MKKRYIYASLLASLLFLIVYVFLSFNVILSIILTVFAYIGGILFFKEKDVRVYDPNLLMHYCYLISKLSNYTNNIKDEKINNNIKDITKEAEKIIVMLEQKPNKVTQVYDGFDFYLPLSIKIIDQYIHLINKDTLTKEEEEFVDEINFCLDNIEVEIKKLLENMNYTKMLDINSSIDIFKTGNKILEDSRLKERE